MSPEWCNKYLICIFYLFLERCDAFQEISAKHLIPLNQYVNQWPAFLHDHIATTWTYSSHPNTLSSYYQLSVLGLVLKSVAAKECNCSMGVVQMVDEFMGLGGSPGKPGLLGKLNHKLERADNQKINKFDNYLRTGEEFYCVTTMGECGATIPLREMENEVEYDTIYNTNFSQPMELGVIDRGIICYIWPKEYHNINAKRHGKKDYEEVREDMNMTPIPNMNNQECHPLPMENGEWLINGLKAFPGTSATLICAPGFTPSNVSSVVVCQEALHWEPFPAICKRRNCKKFDEKHIKGKVHYNVPVVALTPLDSNQYPVGTKASIECKEDIGLSINGVDTVVCNEQGWVPQSLGTCTQVCPRFILNYGNVRYTDAQGYERKSYSNGTVATAVCNPGTKLLGVGTAECHNGEWSNGHLGSCESIQCLRMDTIRKGMIEYSKPKKNGREFSVGDMANLICNDGTQPKGPSESVCNVEGVWEPNMGTCE